MCAALSEARGSFFFAQKAWQSACQALGLQACIGSEGCLASLIAQLAKNLPIMQEPLVQFLGRDQTIAQLLAK